MLVCHGKVFIGRVQEWVRVRENSSFALGLLELHQLLRNQQFLVETLPNDLGWERLLESKKGKEERASSLPVVVQLLNLDDQVWVLYDFKGVLTQVEVGELVLLENALDLHWSLEELVLECFATERNVDLSAFLPKVLLFQVSLRFILLHQRHLVNTIHIYFR